AQPRVEEIPGAIAELVGPEHGQHHDGSRNGGEPPRRIDVLAESHRGAHDPMAERGHAPAARAGDLRHEPVDATDRVFKSRAQWWSRRRGAKSADAKTSPILHVVAISAA